MENEYHSTGDVLDALAQLNNAAAHLDVAQPQDIQHRRETPKQVHRVPSLPNNAVKPTPPHMASPTQTPSPTQTQEHADTHYDNDDTVIIPRRPQPQPQAPAQPHTHYDNDDTVIIPGRTPAQAPVHTPPSQTKSALEEQFNAVSSSTSPTSLPSMSQAPVFEQPKPTAQQRPTAFQIPLQPNHELMVQANSMDLQPRPEVEVLVPLTSTEIVDEPAQEHTRDAKGRVPIGQPYYGCPPWTAVSRFFRKYAMFIGRASRSEYWWLALIYSLSYAVIIPLSMAVMRILKSGNPYLLAQIWTVLTVIPIISLGVRRLHDANISGVWYVPILVFTYGVGIFAIFGRDHAPGDASSSSIVLFMLFLGILTICSLVALTINVIVMMMPSNPKGRRFDFRIHRKH